MNKFKVKKMKKNSLSQALEPIFNKFICISCIHNKKDFIDTDCKLTKLNRYKDACLNYRNCKDFKLDKNGKVVAIQLFREVENV